MLQDGSPAGPTERPARASTALTCSTASPSTGWSFAQRTAASSEPPLAGSGIALAPESTAPVRWRAMAVISTSASSPERVSRSCGTTKGSRRCLRMSRQMRPTPVAIRAPLRSRSSVVINATLGHRLGRREPAGEVAAMLLALPLLLHLHALGADELVDVLHRGALQQSERVVDRRDRPEGRLGKGRRLDLAPVQAGLGSLALLERDLGTELGRHVVLVLVVRDLAADVVRFKLSLELGLVHRLHQQAAVELQLEGAARIPPGPGYLAACQDLGDDLLAPGLLDVAADRPLRGPLVVQS